MGTDGLDNSRPAPPLLARSNRPGFPNEDSVGHPPDVDLIWRNNGDRFMTRPRASGALNVKSLLARRQGPGSEGAAGTTPPP